MTTIAMQYRPLGQSGLMASVVAFGGGPIGGGPWGAIEESDAIAAVHAFLDEGVNLIDTAPVYGFGASEELVGKAIAGRRDKVLVATKCGLIWHATTGTPFHKTFSGKTVYRYLGKDSIRYEVEQSLRRLHTDYIDLYQTHWQDATTSIDETMETLLSLKKEGKIRAIGVSNCTVQQIEEYRKLGPVDSTQEKYNMLDRALDAEVVPFCDRNNVAILAYMPLAAGLLTGKVGTSREFAPTDLRFSNPLFTPEIRTKVQQMLEEMRPTAQKHDLLFGQLAIAWAVAQKGVTHALVGVKNIKQAKENARAGAAMFTSNDLHVMAEVLIKYGMTAN